MTTSVAKEKMDFLKRAISLTIYDSDVTVSSDFYFSYITVGVVYKEKYMRKDYSLNYFTNTDLCTIYIDCIQYFKAEIMKDIRIINEDVYYTAKTYFSNKEVKEKFKV